MNSHNQLVFSGGGYFFLARLIKVFGCSFLSPVVGFSQNFFSHRYPMLKFFFIVSTFGESGIIILDVGSLKISTLSVHI